MSSFKIGPPSQSTVTVPKYNVEPAIQALAVRGSYVVQNAGLLITTYKPL